MNCYVIVEEIPYEGYDILGVELNYDAAEKLFNKACEKHPNDHIYAAEIPMGELIYFYNYTTNPILNREAKKYNGKLD